MSRRLLSMKQTEAVFYAFDKWGFDEKGWSPVTRHKYVRRVRAADTWLTHNRGVSLMRATPKDLKAYLFSTGATARNRNNIRQALVGVGDFLVEQGFMAINAALALPRLPEQTSTPRVLDVAAARKVAAAASTFGAMYEMLICLFLYAGLRRNEARLLEWRNIEGDGSWLRFKGKGNKERALPVHDALKEAILRWRGQCPDPQYCFPSPRRRGEAISETHLRIMVSDVGDRAGVPALHPHALRHTFATRLVEKDVHLRTIQEALGHADPKTTAIYAHIRSPELRESMKKLDF